MKREHAEKEKTLEMQLEQARVTRVTRFADLATSSLTAEQAMMQLRLDQAAAESRVRLDAGLAVVETTLQRAEGLMAAEHCEDLMQVVAAQRQSFREHDAIRDQEAAVYSQAWQHHEQVRQWHGS